MKFGIRKPSLKKSLRARTTGKLKRKVKKALIPGYGKKGMGWIKNPKKAAYNKIYSKTTFIIIPKSTGQPKKKSKKSAKVAAAGLTGVAISVATARNRKVEILEGESNTMKVCKYCGAENDNKVKICSSCGANDFKYKCENCGAEFEEGLYCPNCGVKVGQKAKKCPECGTEYYSNACPNCGYNGSHKNTTTANVYVTTAKPKKKRKIWLWVLGRLLL